MSPISAPVIFNLLSARTPAAEPLFNTVKLFVKCVNSVVLSVRSDTLSATDTRESSIALPYWSLTIIPKLPAI